jgi:hypothetical protein
MIYTYPYCGGAGSTPVATFYFNKYPNTQEKNIDLSILLNNTRMQTLLASYK